MNIFYFTTALESNDFNDLNKIWNSPINPSNQNFHNKLIRSLSLKNNVFVFSFRPFSKRKCTLPYLKSEQKIIENINWNYLKIKNNKILRLLSTTIECSKIIKKLAKNDSIIITDTINPIVLTVANKMSRKYKMPIIGLCTDSPSNIAGTSRAYTLFLLKKSNKLDGYITLTSGLNSLFNKHEKPYQILHGLVENKLPQKEDVPYKNYLFFGGALLERYGIYNLIRAFKEIENPELSFIFCGHHYETSKLLEEIKDDKRIKFLGTIPIENVLALEQHALANINPRGFSEDLDLFSIPSKTIEYFNSGVPTISVRNTILQKLFTNDAIWTKSNSLEDLKDGINRLLQLTETERKNLGKSAKEKAFAMFSLESVSNQLQNFLQSFILK